MRRGVYTFDGTKFARTLVLPESREYSASEVADAINAYVSMVDRMLNNYFAGRYTTDYEMERDYVRYLSTMPIRI